MILRPSRLVCSMLVLLLLLPALVPVARAAPPPTANERLVDIIGQPITTIDPGLRQHLVRLLDQSDRDRQRGKPESTWRAQREQVVLEVLKRTESQDFAIRGAFRGLLGRSPSAKELKSFRQTVNSADTRAAIQRIASSDEYLRGPGSGTGPSFLEALFQDILVRAIDPDSKTRLERLLASGTPRSAIVVQLLSGREYQERIVRGLYRSRGLGEPNAAQLADGLTLLGHADGYRQLLARVLASDAYSRVVLTAPEPTLGPAGGGLPLPPEISLGSTWSHVPTVPPGDFNTQDIAAAPDGTLWRAGNDGVYVYASVQGTWSQVPPPATMATLAVAPVSATQAWVLVAEQGPGPSSFRLIDTAGTVTPYPGPAECPGGSCLQMLSATALSSRGVLWALTQAGNVYTFTPTSPTGQQWTMVPAGGFDITAVSGVGAASGGVDAYALAGTQALQHSSAGWTPVSFLAGTVIQSIQGCADGSAWALTNIEANLAQIRPGEPWSLITLDLKVTPPSTDASKWAYLAAASKNRLYAAFVPKNLDSLRYRYWALSIGVVDQPPTPFPPMTPGQQAAYNSISLQLGVTVAGGVRAQYPNVGQTFSDWYTEVTTGKLVKPASVATADWNTMLTQIGDELLYVKHIVNLFTLGIMPLNQQIQSVVGPLPGPAAQVVGLTTPQDQQDSVGLFFADIFASAFSAVVKSFGIPGAIASGVLGSVLGAVVNSLSPGVSPQDPVVQAYANLAGNLASLFQTTDALAGSYYTSIVSDWGMLRTVGVLLNSGQWSWSYSEAATIALATELTFQVSFYQALFAAKWQIVNTLYGDYVQIPWTLSPGYDTYQVPCPSCNQYGFPVEYLWFANLLGNPGNLNENLSPFPQDPVFFELFELGIDFDDFWRSENGWTTKQVPATE